ISPRLRNFCRFLVTSPGVYGMEDSATICHPASDLHRARPRCLPASVPGSSAHCRRRHSIPCRLLRSVIEACLPAARMITGADLACPSPAGRLIDALGTTSDTHFILTHKFALVESNPAILPSLPGLISQPAGTTDKNYPDYQLIDLPTRRAQPCQARSAQLFLLSVIAGRRHDSGA